MVYKYGPNKLIKTYQTELVQIRIELKMHNIQIIDNDFNDSNILCFRKSFLFFLGFSLIRF